MSSLSFSDVAKAMKAAAAKAMGNTAPVPVIQWRLEVCSECPKRREAKAAKEKASVALSGQFADKNVCDVCGCSLVLLTSATESNLHDDSPEEREARPKTCWMLSE